MAEDVMSDAEFFGDVNKTCLVCGKFGRMCYDADLFEDGYSNNTHGICSDKCFDKHFWGKYIKEKDNKRCIRVNGMHYYISDDTESGFKGFGGAKFHIKRFDSDDIIETANLWTQGHIPEGYRIDLPDNAVFLKVKGDKPLSNEEPFGDI